MDGVPLKRQKVCNHNDIDSDKCIICQQDLSNEKTLSTENGRNRILEASEIWQDIVTKRLQLVDKSRFVYHMSDTVLHT